MAGFDWVGRLWTFARDLENLLAAQAKTRATLEAVDARLRAIEDRLIRLEADQGQLITEARAAAGVAATGLAASVISDVVTRVTRLEMQRDDGQNRLPPPT